jgi:hypothetical protein
MKRVRLNEIYSWSKRSGQVGLELEVEARPGGVLPLGPEVGGVWLSHNDGSLRNGIEYVTRQPLSVKENKITHIKRLTDMLRPDVIVQNSPRTSFHVHVNVSNYYLSQVWTGMLAFWLIEQPLIEYCGKLRTGNPFCLRLSDAEGVVDSALKGLSERNRDLPFRSFDQEMVKYSSLNPAVIARQGSVEIRTMNGTTDPVELDDWSTNCYQIINSAAESFDVPDHLFDYYENRPVDELIDILCIPKFAKHIKGVDGYKKMVLNNYGILCELAYAKNDWLAWENHIHETFLTNKKEEPVVQSEALDFLIQGDVDRATWNPATWDIAPISGPEALAQEFIRTGEIRTIRRNSPFAGGR